MVTAASLAGALGRQNIARATGVGLKAVSNAVTRGAFPPSWFLAMQVLAAQKGVECPASLFGMKVIPQDVDVAVVVQEPAHEKGAA